MRKRIISAALFLTLLLLMPVTAIAAGSGTFPDVPEDAGYAEAVEVLAELGVLQGDNTGNFNPNSSITRAETAAIICRLLGVEEQAKTRIDSVFTDVPSSHWAVGYIAEVVKLGIVNGYGNKMFGPSDPVTQQQMIKMLVCAWGYEYDAENLGGWPNGYIQVAESLGIIEDADYIANAPASRSMVAEWAYNVLYIDPYVEG